MESNDVFLLGTMVENDRAESAPSMDPGRHQVFYVAKQRLKQLSAGHDDLLAGIVDGEKDCGIDAMYLFANSLCLRDDTQLKGLGREARLELFIVQVKNTSGFAETPIDKLLVHLPKILDFGRDEDELADTVNPRLIEISRRFLDSYRSLDAPELRITIVFAALKAEYTHPSIEKKANELRKCLLGLFSGCQPEVEFLGAKNLFELARVPRRTEHKLPLAENPIATDTSGGYVAVVKLGDYEKFITGKDGKLDGTLFEANVRDYEGETLVNESIRETLTRTDGAEDFWWLNNGVTIVAQRVTLANKLLTLESPQIVNGLQTSTEIYKRGRANFRKDRRSLLVKVIEAKENAVRDRIIRATNSQNEFGPSVLRATDRVQRQIEDYLITKGLFYERRRLYYFNQNKPVDQIVSIDEMGQAVLSVLVQRPDIARSSPSKIFDREIYEDVFNPTFPLPMYYSCVRLLRDARDQVVIDAGVGMVEDFQFHLAMLVGMVLTRKPEPTSQDVAKLEGQGVTTAKARELLKLIKEVYTKANRDKKLLLLDRLAKDHAVTKLVLERGRAFLGPVPTPSLKPPRTQKAQRRAGRLGKD